MNPLGVEHARASGHRSFIRSFIGVSHADSRHHPVVRIYALRHTAVKAWKRPSGGVPGEAVLCRLEGRLSRLMVKEYEAPVTRLRRLLGFGLVAYRGGLKAAHRFIRV